MVNKNKKRVDLLNYRLILFNLIIVFIFLLRSAGYFQPYFPISVNFMVMVAIILAVFLLGITSRTIFIIALLFWLFAGVLRVLRIDIWAERTGVYVFESLLLAILFLLWEVTMKNMTKLKAVIKVIADPIKKLLGV